MIRSAASKVAWAGKTASMMFGLALIVALIFGVASVGLAANGQPFLLGKAKNTATKVTGLIGKVASGPALQVTNPSGGSALGLQVNTGQAPLTVNADAGKATNLNADKVDDLDSAQLMQGGGKIHSYGPVILSANAPIQELVVVGPFLIRGLCEINDMGHKTTLTQLMVDEAARPYSVARHTSTGFHSSPNSTDDRVDLMRDIQSSVMNTTMGSVVSLKGDDRQITFNLYQHRTTNPTGGADSCTFGGYVQE